MATSQKKVCPRYNIASDGEALALELLEVWSTLSLSLLPGQLWLGAVPVKVQFMGQIDLFKNIRN